MSDLDIEMSEIPIEDDRDVLIENSHLARGTCGCGASALYSPAHVARTECGSCLAVRTGGGGSFPELLGKYTPVRGGTRFGTGSPAVAEREAYPLPEWTSRDARGTDSTGAPEPVLTLAGDVRARGGWAHVQSSRGRPPHGATGAPTAVRTLWGVVMRGVGGSWGAYAVRDASTWRSVMLWGPEVPWFAGASVTDLREFIAADGRVAPEWFDAVRARETDRKAREKAREACNKGVHVDQGAIGCVTWCAVCGHSWPTGREPWRKPKTGKAKEGLS